MMQLTLSQLNFTVSLNACHDEIMHKMQILTNMEIQLLRKFQHQTSNSQMHFRMIHDVRIMIVNLQEVYKDVKQYFNEMNIMFVYDFFRKIQVLMISGYNFLSQALLVNADQIQDQKNKNATCKDRSLQCKICKCTCSDSITKKRQIKQVQQYDYKISMLQYEQQKIASQIQNIYDKMMMQRTMIEKTKPSLAVRELQDMKEHIQNVLQSTNSVFEESYMMKYVQFKNYLTQIKKPQDIVDYFISNMTFSMKEKFLKAMQKTIYKAQNMDEKIEIKHFKDIEVQTDKVKQTAHQRQSVCKGLTSLKSDKNSNLLTKQRKYNEKMMAEVQYIQKQLNTLLSQSQKLKKQLKDKETERSQYQQNYQTLEQLYNKKTFELQNIQLQNKWLSSQKQTETKKLKLQIKQLKKDQIQTISQQTQVFLSPNSCNASTQTEIVCFQNQVDNEIINVLKKSNDKMIQNLNQKQKKIRQLTVNKDQLQIYKHCRNICLDFLEDLRQVTTYKMTEFNKENPKNNQTKTIEPIIPLNESTSNNSVMIIINKLTDDVKTLLLSSNSSRKKLNQKKRTSGMKNSVYSPNSRQSSRKSSKISQLSENTEELFFRNTMSRKSSVISLQKQTEIVRIIQVKKSTYQMEYIEKNERRSSKSISETDEISQQNKIGQSLFQPAEKATRNNSFEKRTEFVAKQRNLSSIKEGQNALIYNNSMKSKINLSEESVQTDIFKLKIENNSSFLHQSYSVFCEYSQQTDITFQQLTNFELTFQKQAQQLQKLKNITKNNSINFQSYSTRKHPYIRKPTGRSTTGKFTARDTERDYDSVNNSIPINENSTSSFIQQNFGRTRDQSSFIKYHNTINDSSSTPNINKQSNMTLQSRLEALINPKNNSFGSNSNIIIFKKPNQDYQKKTSKLVFDELKVDRQLKEKQKQLRSTYRNDSLIISTQNDKPWKQVVNTIGEEIQSQKQNIRAKPRNQVHLKSIFIQKLMQKDQDDIKLSTHHSTLIDVSRKTPLKRQRQFSPKDYQLSDNVFIRTVKQMLLSSQSKQGLMRKIQEICETMQKQKNSKKLKKIIKKSCTPRDLIEQREDSKNYTSQVFKLG